MWRRAVVAASSRLSTRPLFQSLRTSTNNAAAASVSTSLPPNLHFDEKSSFHPDKKALQTKPRLRAPKIPPQAAVQKEKEEDVEKDDGFYDELDNGDFDYASDATKKFVIPLPDRLQVPVYDGLDGSLNGSIALNPSVFGFDDIRIDLINRAVTYARNKIRGKRTAKTKTIGEVSGSGRKVRKQKGSGMARAGHSRPAHWRGGAKAHGIKGLTDYGDIKLNKKMRRLAIRHMLSQKLKEGNLILVDHFRMPTYKTKELVKVLSDSFGIGAKKDGATALILDHHLSSSNDEDEKDDNGDDDKKHESYAGVPVNLWVASSNIPKVRVANQRKASTYNIIQKEKLVLTLAALEKIESRYKQ